MAKALPLFITPKVPAIEQQIAAAGLPVPEREVRFHPVRMWRFDLAWPTPLQIAFEIEGMVYGRMVETADGKRVRVAGGRHATGTGIEADIEKYNAAALLGWLVIRGTNRQISNGKAIEWLQEAFKRRSVQT
jgi:hypothetical protein